MLELLNESKFISNVQLLNDTAGSFTAAGLGFTFVIIDNVTCIRIDGIDDDYGRIASNEETLLSVISELAIELNKQVRSQVAALNSTITKCEKLVTKVKGNRLSQFVDKVQGAVYTYADRDGYRAGYFMYDGIQYVLKDINKGLCLYAETPGRELIGGHYWDLEEAPDPMDCINIVKEKVNRHFTNMAKRNLEIASKFS